jgi:hypothetical protein
MKVLFLDIDGVLNSNIDFFELRKFGHPINQVKGSQVINRGHLALLQQIIEDTDAKIVLSTTWRRFYTLDEIYEMFTARDFSLGREVLHDITPCLTRGFSDDHTRHRGSEIREYLRAHPEVEKYLVLDDLKEPLINPQGRYEDPEDQYGSTPWEDRVPYEPFVEVEYDGYANLTPEMNFINTNGQSGLTVFQMHYAIKVLGLNEEAQKREDEYQAGLSMLMGALV